MKSLTKRKARVVVENGKPSDVIISLREYEELLGKAQDMEHLEYIRKLTKKDLQSRPFKDFMKEHFPSV